MTDDATTAYSNRRRGGDRLCLTVLAHPCLRRIGDRVELEGSHAVVSRNTPLFSASGSALESRRVSRRPVQFSWGADGVWVDGDTARVHGKPGLAQVEIGLLEARQGFYVAMGAHVLLYARLIAADVVELDPKGPTSPELRQCVLASRTLLEGGTPVALVGGPEQGRSVVVGCLDTRFLQAGTAGGGPQLRVLDQPYSVDASSDAPEWVPLPPSTPVEDLAQSFGSGLCDRLATLGRHERISDCAGWLQADDALALFRDAPPSGPEEAQRVAQQLAMQVGDRAELPAAADGLQRERDQLVQMLRRYDYRISVCAKVEGVSPNTLRRLMQFHGVHTASDVPDALIEQARGRTGGDVVQMARLLEVSEHGLRLRLGRSSSLGD